MEMVRVFKKKCSKMNEVFDLSYEDVVDEKLLLSSKNLMKPGKFRVNFDGKYIKD
jgi:hypothetical protein